MFTSQEITIDNKKYRHEEIGRKSADMSIRSTYQFTSDCLNPILGGLKTARFVATGWASGREAPMVSREITNRFLWVKRHWISLDVSYPSNP